MLVFQNAWGSTDLPRGAVVTLGNYDGIHLGQRAILDRVVARAAELGAPSAVVTFSPHPLAVLRPREAPAMLTTPAQKERLIEAAGIELLVVLRFDQELATRPAEEFVRRFLAQRLGVREVFVGRGFRFGRSREGNVDMLRTLGEELGFAVSGVPEVEWESEPVSSTRIRHALLDGRVEEAAAMLGRPYELVGKVLRGDRMGQKLGWPTINLQVENGLIPRDGVYAARAELATFPRPFDAATNIGTRPTVYENFHRVVESHILDFNANVYGQTVALRFHKRLREERLFPSIMDLSAQIARDVQATRDFFAPLRREEAERAAAAGESFDVATADSALDESGLRW